MNKINFKNKNPYLLHYNDKNLLDINEYDNAIILDFFDLIAYICYTDFFTIRDEDVNNKERLSVTVPVNNIETFNNIRKDIEVLLTYMTNGEKWDINFENQKEKKKIEREQKSICNNIKYNSICVLSGGLDSMAGSVVEKRNNTIFVTFETNPIEVSNSNDIYEKLIKNDNNKHVIIRKLNLAEDEHYTERTRSLIFIASSLIYADYYNIDKIKIYENGIMSLNPKFNFSRRVTKTTNQKTLFLINEILKKLGIDVKVINPFKYKTKADIINIIPEEYNQHIINNTRTCSKNPGIRHFRNKKKGNFHCGMCIACILRQIGMISNHREDCEYLLPESLADFKDIEQYEKIISKEKDPCKDQKASLYKFNEKRSLLEYYKLFYKNIKKGTIYNYLDMKEEYYEDIDWQNKIEEMLEKFTLELEEYFKQIRKRNKNEGSNN